MTIESSKLAMEACRGEEAALEELIARHLLGLRAYVRFKTGRQSWPQAGESDVVESVCREVLRQAPTCRHGGEAGFRHWLYTTALPRILERGAFRATERHGVHAEEAPRFDGTPKPVVPNSVLGLPMTRDEFERVSAAIDELDPEQREVLALLHVVGLSAADVASEMGRTEASVRARADHALARVGRRSPPSRSTSRAAP